MTLPWPARVALGHPRTFAAIAIGVVAYVLLPHALTPAMRAILAWDAGALAFLVMAAILFATAPIERIPEEAEAQQEGEWTVFWITILGAVASFAALALAFGGDKNAPAAARHAQVAMVAATLLLSWLVTHTLFTFRYAHEYYERGNGPGGFAAGLDFPGDERPDYWDFFYFSLVLGMTFQVSDVDITARRFRRLAAAHGLIGFLFNTVIVALTVNMAAGMF